jgi:hypothetical protein
MWASASLAFRANNAVIMGVSVRTHHIKAADVAEIVEVAKIVEIRIYALGATTLIVLVIIFFRRKRRP